jgi:large subunit ribosomal protein L3
MAGSKRPAKIASAKSAAPQPTAAAPRVVTSSAERGLGLIGRKVGMTQIFQDDGTMVAVSVVEIEPNTVTRLRTPDRDGYTALQLGTENARKLSKPETGQFKALPKGTLPATVHEFRLDNIDQYELGQKLDVTLFAAGELVDITGVSKGKGFSGHIKRHHFKRGPKTHGSDHHREPGSIGPGTTPGRVYKGMRMAGHMGDERVTIKKLRVVRADAERNLLLVKGTLPGARNALIFVKKV